MTQPIDDYFRSQVDKLGRESAPTGRRQLGRAETQRVLECFEVQVQSRWVDFAARRLQSHGQGFYTIASSGHELNAIVGQATRPTDPALLHYRSGAFYLARARQVTEIDGVRDILLGVVAASADPASGGRHKVFGRAELAVIPQTSTIASHVPRAVGVARAIQLAPAIGRSTRWPSDAIAVCSVGDASINHATCLAGLNAASNDAFRGRPLPLLFVCEDNALGISVPTPEGWVESALSKYAAVRYEQVDGTDLLDAVSMVDELVAWIREYRAPAVLHLRVVRLMGHAGSDAEVSYRTQREIEDDYARDPLLQTAAVLLTCGALTSEQILQVYDLIADQVLHVANEVAMLPRIGSREELMSPLDNQHHDDVRSVATTAAVPDKRLAAFRSKTPEERGGLTLAQSINATLIDVMAAHGDVVVFGEDVGVKGGVYGVTGGLQRRFGGERVFDTILDEQTILGTALGLAVSGLMPIPEIQYLAYLHNAEDQIRGEAATLAFFSAGAFRNGMVVRIAGLADQQGFGGHFHNDNALGVLRDIPGIVVAVPSSAADAPHLLRTCLAQARVDGRVCVFVEPIALYHRRDLYDDGDGLWVHPYRPPGDWSRSYVSPGRANVVFDGDDILMLTYGNGVPMSMRVARRLESQGIRGRVVDLRWLSPLPMDDVYAHAMDIGRVVVVDECRRSGGIAEGVLAGLDDRGYQGVAHRVTSEDTFIPLGDAARFALLGEQAIERAVTQILM